MKPTKEQMAVIKKMKQAANKAISKVIESTFDANIRNQRTLEINRILSDSIATILNHK